MKAIRHSQLKGNHESSLLAELPGAPDRRGHTQRWEQRESISNGKAWINRSDRSPPEFLKIGLMTGAKLIRPPAGVFSVRARDTRGGARTRGGEGTLGHSAPDGTEVTLNRLRKGKSVYRR